MKKNPKTLEAQIREWMRSDFWKGLLAGAILTALVVLSWRLALFAFGAAAVYWLLRRSG